MTNDWHMEENDSNIWISSWHVKLTWFLKCCNTILLICGHENFPHTFRSKLLEKKLSHFFSKLIFSHTTERIANQEKQYCNSKKIIKNESIWAEHFRYPIIPWNWNHIRDKESQFTRLDIYLNGLNVYMFHVHMRLEKCW